ncbi:hypothetical protein VW35_06725 [Devosia soli]|uniref:Uncharacterized protein n=1 Tax=Devosia soli TaxID=361041 RepID=A0A0F5LCZ3_9HYPH|nr:hypothetical protein VW35_06725 [Devosia soli]
MQIIYFIDDIRSIPFLRISNVVSRFLKRSIQRQFSRSDASRPQQAGGAEDLTRSLRETETTRIFTVAATVLTAKVLIGRGAAFA